MEAKISTELGERFEDIKRHFKLNNSTLARIAGCSPQAIHDIVSGVTDNPKIGLIKSLSAELKINLDWLLFGHGVMLKADLNTNEPMAGSVDESVFEFFREKLAKKDQIIFERDRQLFEKDNLIARLRGRSGKRKGVFNQASLFPTA